MVTNELNWWENEGGFFGSNYIKGDNSLNGYLPNHKETLSERTLREVKGIEYLLQLKKSAKILDVPCGYGRHSIELAKRGYGVDGFDINAEHLRRANKLVLDSITDFPLDEDTCSNIPVFSYVDMRNLAEFQYLQADAVINMFYSFGFFQTDEENESVMKGFCNQLKPGGQLLLHTDVSPEMILEGKKYKMCETRDLSQREKLRITEEFNPNSRRVEGNWTIISESGEETLLTPYSVRIYTAQEFQEMDLQRFKFMGLLKVRNLPLIVLK